MIAASPSESSKHYKILPAADNPCLHHTNSRFWWDSTLYSVQLERSNPHLQSHITLPKQHEIDACHSPGRTLSPLFNTRCLLPRCSTDALPPFPIHAPSCAYSSSSPASPAASAPPGVPDIRTQTPVQSLTLESTSPLPKLKHNFSSNCCGNKIPQIQMSALCTCSWLLWMRWWWEPGSTRLLGSGALSASIAETCDRKALHFLAEHLLGLVPSLFKSLF